jgi:hypothetical protein
MLLPALLLSVLALVPSAALAVTDTQAPDACADWQSCRQQTTDALTRGEFETAHDLAWRTVQKGPKTNNSELLYLLARAQCLSGRAHDALVMLERIADSGIAANAIADDDFRRTRELPGWPAVAERLTAAAAGAPAPSPSPAGAAVTPPVTRAPAPAAPPPPNTAASEAKANVAPPPVLAPKAGVVEAARFMTRRFAAGGLAYDAVSRRFLFGDRDGRKLITAGDGFDHAVDFVRADSAGFHQVMSIEIDVRRGDLWVASAERDGGAGALHKVQLISGRPLKTFDAPADLSLKLVDLAVTAEGAILILDAIGGHVLELKARAEQMESILKLSADAPTSLALGRAGEVAYVSHGSGLLRLDLATRKAALMTGPKGVELGGFERIRWHRGALVGIQKARDGSRQVVRLQLNATGRAVTKATIVDAPVPASDGAVFATVSGDELSYFVSTDEGSSTAESDQTEVIVYRVPLR